MYQGSLLTYYLSSLHILLSTKNDLIKLLSKGRAKKGMFEGDLVEGELEIGQIAGLIHDIKPVAKIVEDIMAEFEEAKTLL